MADNVYGFKNVNSYSEPTFSDSLEASMYSWLRYSLINIGAFWNLDKVPFVGDTSSYELPYGNSKAAELKTFDDPRYTPGCYWAGFRSQWLWESESTTTLQPKGPVTSVWVDGVENHISDGGFKVDYNEGAVIFTTPVDSSSSVTCDFSFMAVQVRRSDEPFFQEIQARSMRKDETFDVMDILNPNRVQLPCIITDPTNLVSIRPFEIGNRSRWQQQDFMMHILAETPWEARRIRDILIEQYDDRIEAYSLKTIIESRILWDQWNAYWSSIFTQWSTPPLANPLENQYRVDSPSIEDPATYPGLVAVAPWRKLRIMKIDSNNQEQLGKTLFTTTVNYRIEFDI